MKTPWYFKVFKHAPYYPLSEMPIVWNIFYMYSYIIYMFLYKGESLETDVIKIKEVVKKKLDFLGDTY